MKLYRVYMKGDSRTVVNHYSENIHIFLAFMLDNHFDINKYDFSPYQDILEQEGAKVINKKVMLGNIMIEDNTNPTLSW